MIVERQVYEVHPGCIEKAAQLMREEDDATRALVKSSSPPARIYSSMFGSQLQVAIEWTRESQEKMDADWAAWFGSGRTAAFFDAWAQVSTRYLAHELRPVFAASTVEGERNGIAVRWTCEHNVRQEQVMADLWKQWIADSGTYTARVLMPWYGATSHVILEVEYADLADYETRMAVWASQEGIEGFWEAFNPTFRSGGMTEVWRLMP